MLDQLLYITDGFWREIGDQRVHSNYPLMSGGPIPIIAIVSIYVYFVRSAGPAWMKARDAYDLKWSIRLYNILMSLINLYIFYRVSVLTRYGLNYFGCKQVGYEKADNELVDLAFLYFATKLVELLDTIFFILRKKYNQASNLHVFHHGFIAICVWIYFKIAPGGSSVLFPYLNVGVHSVMYSYYFLATFPAMQKYLWWKRYLTSTQIIQFVLSMVHFSFQGLSSCEYPPALAVIGFFFNFVFFVLFCDFYYHAYMRAKPTSGRRQATESGARQQEQRRQKLGEQSDRLTQEFGQLRQRKQQLDANNNTDQCYLALRSDNNRCSLESY